MAGVSACIVSSVGVGADIGDVHNDAYKMNPGLANRWLIVIRS